MKKPLSYLSFAVVGLALLIASCANPNQFNQAVEKEIAGMKFTIPISEVPFPISIEDSSSNAQLHWYLKEFVDAGLFSSSKTTIGKTRYTFDGAVTDQVAAVSYQLTDKGSQLYYNDEDASGSMYGFIIADAKLVSIDGYSKPKNLNGKTVSDVTFTYTGGDLYPWTEKIELGHYIAEVNVATTAHQKTITLEKSSSGWSSITDSHAGVSTVF
jgi:hypothetical protein